MSILGNPILLGETDTFAALLYASQDLAESVTNISGWYLTFNERATATTDIVTINEAGHYRVKMYSNPKYSSSKPIATHTTITIYHNSTPVSDGDTFDAKVGDTVRLRGSCAKSGVPEFPNSQGMVITAIIEKVPAS